METLRALSEPREAPAGCYEVTDSFGFTQEERERAARSVQQGSDILGRTLPGLQRKQRDSQGQIHLCAGLMGTQVPMNRTYVWCL